MPRALRGSEHELSLTSSFVAGGFAYHVDPRDIIAPGHGGKPLVFFRFEDPDNRRQDLTSDESYFADDTSNIAPILSSTFGSGIGSIYPTYTTSTPYLFTNHVTGSKLTSDESRQIRSLEFGENAGTFNVSLSPGGPKVDNVSPTTRIVNGLGSDHVSLNVQNNVFTGNLLGSFFSSFKGITISAWIKARETELVANYGSSPLPSPSSPESTTIHYRPIFRSRKILGADEALISFGIAVSLKNPDSGLYYHENLHKHLYFRFKDSYGTVPITWISYDRAPIDDNWHHVAIAIDQDNSSFLNSDTSIRFYCDGMYLKSFPFNVVPMNKTTIETNVDWMIGGVEEPSYVETVQVPPLFPIRVNAIGSFFLGNIDDLAVWNRGLSGDEIAAIYSAHRGAFKPDSGYLNNPSRVIIRDMDNLGGQYPTSNIAPGVSTGNAFKEGD